MALRHVLRLAIAGLVLLSACQPGAVPATGQGPVKVLAVETFLADIAQNVAGDRLHVDALLPVGVDPHAYEPTPSDVARVAGSQVLIVNGAGFEAFLGRLLDGAGGSRTVIEASQGLAPRTPQPGEAPTEHAVDPHFWLNPLNAIRYVENIRDGLTQADPDGAAVYARNAEAYIARLRELDSQIAQEAAQVPPARRLLVTNHESLGYWADRYGFRIVGAIIPSVSTDASPSAQQLAELVDRIRASGAPAIFLETGANAQLAQQVADETGVRVVTDLYTHSTTDAGGPAPTYIALMQYDAQAIVEALK